MIAYALLVVAVAAQRLVEALISRRNAAWSLQRGGVEFGRRHYPFLVVLHVGLLTGCLVEPLLAHRDFVPLLGWPMFGLLLGAQALRVWCISTLGPRWNFRVIVVPGLPRVRSGPYRYLSHPNYVAVVVEGLALPLIHSAWITATAFTVLNVAALSVRIRTEERALGLATATV
ncbi:isoprenylcysteine carboxyl methyltransferase family protein [Actinopolymorpha pittospori]